MSYRAYARSQGVSLMAIQKRIKQGTITENAITRVEGKHPKIDSDIADADFAARVSTHGANTAAMQRPGKIVEPPPPAASVIDEMFDETPASPVTPVTKHPKSVLKTEPPKVERPEVITKMIDGKEVDVTKIPYAGENSFDRYRGAKASTEEIRSRKLSIELELLEGRVVEVEDIKKEIQTICTMIRENMLNVPAKVAPQVLSCSEVVEVETILYKEINMALETLSRLLDARADT